MTLSRPIDPFLFRNATPRQAKELAIQGELPAYAKGTYYLNGPALFHRNGLRHPHWLDGDGMLRRLRLGAKAEYRSRFVEGSKFKTEQAADRFIFRTFGHSFEGDQLHKGLSLKANPNVSVYPFGDQLLAFGEQARPYALDPESLETLGEVDFGGVLPSPAPFSAHPKHCPLGKGWANFGIQFLPKSARLHYFEFDLNNQVRLHSTIRLSQPISIHDFVLTEHYSVIYLTPYVLRLRHFLQAGQSLQEALEYWPHEPAKILIIERATGNELTTLTLPETQACLHLPGGYERDGQLVVDAIESKRPFYQQYVSHFNKGMFDTIAPNQAVRYIIDPTLKQLRSRKVIPTDFHFDFPQQNQHTHDFEDFWALGMAPTCDLGPRFYDRLLRFNWPKERVADGWQAPTDSVLGGEPLHLVDPQEPEGGLILNQLFDLKEDRSSYVFFAAYDLAAGPVATIPLSFYDPIGFHSSFAPYS